MRVFYLTMAIIGTVIPWIFFGSYIAANGVNIIGFVRDLFDNDASSGSTADVLIATVVFWVWSFFDARQTNVTKWWFVLPTGICVGLSLALPLYLYLRESARA
ncbi:DUF2834 domain-containing protein [Rhizobium sp. L1K21]|uniref:DUF2834 domain-containing protein n=1 Tax=Rhizobium sp. L1K21 TaxID=2954933 RepID=UPI002093DD31|nr:DUF2834 domain-containing protein [Rhizobium sp. L1K21]MCO6185866.1 DUF2834 domain-containing protein [Rhizobium sp. L1K21]